MIIKESLINEQILDEIEILNVEIWKTDNVPKYWTAISFISHSENFPEHLSKAIGTFSESGMVWYVDIRDDVYKYIVLKDIVLKFILGMQKKRKKYVKDV